MNTKIKIDCNRMDYIKKGAGSKKIMYIACGIIILILLTKLLFASELTLEETKEQLGGNPYKIAEWMGENIKYVSEDIQYTQPVEYTYKHKEGDCEDWAILSQYFIGNKYETYLVVWHGEYREDSIDYEQEKDNIFCHAVLAIKLYSNNWVIIDNDDFISNGSSLIDIIKIDCELWRADIRRAYIADLYQYRQQIIKEINIKE